jgi:uncharacterized RDD family membrane protein YckC
MEKILLSVLARPSKRYLASIIDGLVVGLLVLPMFIYGHVNDLIGEKLVYFTIAFLLFKVFVYLLVDCLIPVITNGKSIGRYFMNIRLVKRNGGYATVSNYLLRAIIFIVIALVSDILVLPFVAYGIWCLVFVLSIYWIYNDDYRMTVHDKVAGTIVIQNLEIECKE